MKTGYNTYSMRVGCDYFNAHAMFISEFDTVYDTVTSFHSEKDVPQLLKKLDDLFPEHEVTRKKSVWIDENTLKTRNGDNDYFYIVHAMNTIVHINTDMEELSISVYTTNEKTAVIDRIKAVMPDTKQKTQNRFSVICYNDGYFYTKSLDLDNFGVEAVDITDTYNDDFQETAAHILDQLEKRTKGIVLLHGEAGTGKTSFLKHLIATVTNKEFIYLPPDMAHLISKPEFFTFMLDHKKAVLLIEDAENVLKEREAGDGQAVSNLLNVSDGILGSALKFQAICTLNSQLDTIDKALLRPGRLIASYHFGKLTVEKSNNLLKKVFGKGVETNKELTLAEIFNFDQKRYSNQKEKQKLGFT